MLRNKTKHLLEFEVQNYPDGKVIELLVGYLRQVCDGFAEWANHEDGVTTLKFWGKIGNARCL